MSKDLVPSEPRSFLKGEEPYEGVVEMKGDIITSSRPTNREIGDGLNHLNREFETHKGKTAGDMKDLKSDMKKLKEAVLPENGKMPSGLTSQRSSFFRTVLAVFSALGGALIAWQVIAALAPGVGSAFSALNNAIVSGKLH